MYVYHGNISALLIEAAGDYACLYFLSIAGPREATRAIWAALVKHGHVTIDGEAYRLDRGWYDEIKYYRFARKLPSGNHHLVLVHPSATSQHLHPGVTAYLRGDGRTPPGLFFPILTRITDVPMLSEWAPYLWQKGLEREYIEPLPLSLGREWWLVRPGQEWLAIVQDGLKEGAIG